MFIGLDIGGTKTEMAVFSANLTLLSSRRIPTVKNTYLDFLTMLANLVHHGELECGKCVAVGLGMPGLRTSGGRSLSANVPCANGKNVPQDLEKMINVPVVVENDCRCFALSEAHGGAGVDCQSVYGAILGTGAAGGFVVGGRLIPSAQGIAGEYGHRSLPAHLRDKYDLPILECGCGLTGCLENYISGPGMRTLHRNFGGESLSPPDIIDLAAKGDDVASRTLECHTDLLGYSFAGLVMNYDPHVVVIGGGLSLIDGLIDQIPEAMKPHLFKGFHSPPIKKARFGDASGARGAAILARQLVNG